MCWLHPHLVLVPCLLTVDENHKGYLLNLWTVPSMHISLSVYLSCSLLLSLGHPFPHTMDLAIARATLLLPYLCTCTHVTWFLAAVVCSPLRHPLCGYVRQPRLPRFGTVANYSCHIGYGLMGVSSRRCQADGRWSGSSPSCRSKWYSRTPQISMLEPLNIRTPQYWNP